MLLELTSDQEFLRDTTAKYLVNTVPVDELRRRRPDPAGYDEAYWKGGAELGWTSLLVTPGRGGGSVSGSGLLDATLLAYEFGLHAAPGPFVPCNIVAAALSAADNGFADVLDSLLAGTAVASWCFSEGHPSGCDPARLTTEIRIEGDEVVIDGVKRPVESAAQAAHLLVSGRTGDGLSQALVPAGTSGLSIEAMGSVDLTRRFSLVRFNQVRLPRAALIGAPGAAAAAVQRQLLQAIVLTNAESVGAMQRAFDMTLEWSFDRYSFGRPLASYQALKHRFADMRTWLEASHAISDAAAVSLAKEQPDAAELVSAAKAYVGYYGVELAQDCVQMHGGIGITFEHDLHLFLRRVTQNRGLFGTPAEHRRAITDLLEHEGANTR